MLPDKKYLVQLRSRTGHHAVVIDWSPREAQMRAMLFDQHGGWTESEVSIITYVRRSRMNRVLALEKA